MPQMWRQRRGPEIRVIEVRISDGGKSQEATRIMVGPYSLV